MKSINCAIVSLFGLLLILNMEPAAAEFSGENRKNRGHDTLIKMDVDARNRKLADTVEKTGKVCPKGMKTYFQGFDSSSKAYWNVRCRRGDYLLLFPRDRNEGIGIVGCDVVEKAGYPCWERNDQLTYSY
ncbi:MAG: hypothetical protein ACJ0Q3_04350 [Candidatus Azotimanducaceae bacterium]|tara:strand:+ start:147 stop:536 length:390 start_codon:yes stop_codon:yes gene_type:complete